MNPTCPVSAAPARGVRLLMACAWTDFALAAVHVACLFGGEAAARFFTAPRYVLQLIRDGSPLIWPVCFVVVAILGGFGLYAWSAAGRMRPLPLLRAGIVAVGVIFTLRGLVLVPQLLTLARWPWQAPWFSVVALALGVAHLTGARLRWSALAARG